MNLENGPADPSRRRFLKIAGAAAVVGALGVGEYFVGKDTMDNYNKQTAELEEKERPFTHTGTAVILEKIPTVSSGHPTDAEILGMGAAGGMISGAPGAISGVIVGESMRTMNGPHDWQLRIKIDDREPMLVHVFPSDYQFAKVGEEVPIVYVTTEDGKDIKRIKNFMSLQQK
jgi:hypothetical protein